MVKGSGSGLGLATARGREKGDKVLHEIIGVDVICPIFDAHSNTRLNEDPTKTISRTKISFLTNA